MSETPSRRSARAGSRARSVFSPAAFEDMPIVSGKPSRSGKSPAKRKNVPNMPALDPKLSMAYGASGKLNIPTHLDVGNGRADFAKKFGSSRTHAAETLPDDPENGPASRPRGQASQSPSKEPTADDDGSDSPVSQSAKPSRRKSRRTEMNTIDEGNLIAEASPSKSITLGQRSKKPSLREYMAQQQALQEAAAAAAAAESSSANKSNDVTDPKIYDTEDLVGMTSASASETARKRAAAQKQTPPAQSQSRSRSRSRPRPELRSEPRPVQQDLRHRIVTGIKTAGTSTLNFTANILFFLHDTIDDAADHLRHNRAAAAMLVIGMLLAFASIPFSMQYLHKEPVTNARSITGLAKSTWGSVTSFFDGPTYNESSSVRHLSAQIGKLEAQLKTLTTSHSLQHGTISELQRILPDAIAVQKDGSRTLIPANFWPALRDKMKQELGTSVEAPTWDSFLVKNKASLQALVNNEAEAVMANAIAMKRVVSAAEFTEILKENYANQKEEVLKIQMRNEANIQNEFARLTKSIESASSTALTLARESIEEAVRNIPSSQLDNLAEANIVSNAASALSKVNFFSATLGARVEISLSSPTQESISSKNVLNKILTSVLYGTSRTNMHTTALLPWTEAGDCWCAAKPIGYKTGGPAPKAQLAIRMFTAMFPSSLTIEHSPARGTLDIDAAPNELELWVQIRDRQQREIIGRAAATVLARKADPQTYIQEGKSGNGIDTYNGDMSLPKDFVRIAAWRYDIHASNHVQTHEIDVDLAMYDVPVQRAVVRARNNWGANFTCLYRVRLHGLTVRQMEGVREVQRERERAAWPGYAEVYGKQ